jgi:hypothetical protein
MNPLSSYTNSMPDVYASLYHGQTLSSTLGVIISFIVKLCTVDFSAKVVYFTTGFLDCSEHTC